MFDVRTVLFASDEYVDPVICPNALTRRYKCKSSVSYLIYVMLIYLS